MGSEMCIRDRVPTPDPPGGADSDPHGDEWQAGHAGRRQRAKLQLAVGASRAVGRDGEIQAPPRRSDESLQAAYSPARTRAAYRPESEVMENLCEVITVAMFTDQHHDTVVTVGVDEG